MQINLGLLKQSLISNDMEPMSINTINTHNQWRTERLQNVFRASLNFKCNKIIVI